MESRFREKKFGAEGRTPIRFAIQWLYAQPDRVAAHNLVVQKEVASEA
jgi:hypothetical protein